uniref:Uncharacterized protein n=1 Tax=Oryza punctata TaxID=4537 RepID=A0A0E0KVZ1_ORYPU
MATAARDGSGPPEGRSGARQARGGGGTAELAAATAREHGATTTVATTRISWRRWQQRLVDGDSTVAGRRYWRLSATVALGSSRRRQRRRTRGDGCGSGWMMVMGLWLVGGEVASAATAVVVVGGGMVASVG